MLRHLTPVCLCSLLFFQTAAFAQTDVECNIAFENLSREVITVENLSVLKSDGTRQPITGSWALKPGDRVVLLSSNGFALTRKNEVAVKGRQAFYSIRLQDGVVSRGWKSLATKPLQVSWEHASTRGCGTILQTWDDDSLAQQRKAQPAGPLTSGQATYRYWNAVHAAYADELYDVIRNPPDHSANAFTPLAPVSGLMRTISVRIDKLDQTNVDAEAKVLADAWSALLTKIASIVDNVNVFSVGTAILETYNLKVGVLSRHMESSQQAAAQAEDFLTFEASRKKLLEARYGYTLPDIRPPVWVNLQPYLFSSGYYVTICNQTRADLKNVKIRYHDASGHVYHQDVPHRITFGNSVQLDPDSINYRVDKNEWITILWEGGAYSFPTSKLIRK